MGEVGSGKTVVALYAMLRALEAGFQAVLMAPTETLAEQHAATLDRLLGARAGAVRAADRGDARRRPASEAVERLASGELGMVVGTHALIEPTVELRPARRLRRRRAAPLRGRAAPSARREGGRGDGAPRPAHDRDADSPHPLADRLRRPRHDGAARAARRAGRPVETRLVEEDERAAAYEFLRERLREGRQAFVVCPLVAESEKTRARPPRSRPSGCAAGELRELLASASSTARCRSAEKAGAMAAFASGETDVLVATTVIEVGIDVANATVMVIEGAERYGVSQLHQLRGRVGRGEHASDCLLFAEEARRDWPGAGSRRSRARATASSSPRSTSPCAARARCWAPASTGCRASPSPSCRRTRRLLLAAREEVLALLRRHGSLEDPALGPLLDAARRRFGAGAADPIPL